MYVVRLLIQCADKVEGFESRKLRSLILQEQSDGIAEAVGHPIGDLLPVEERVQSGRIHFITRNIS